MKMRCLNDEGLRRMHVFLDSLTTEHPQPYPEATLTDPDASSAVRPSVDVECATFPRRFEIAQYLHERFEEAGLMEPERDKGIWAWLALYWFDQLCWKKNGKLIPGERARWVPLIDNSRRYYRHFVLGPYMLYRSNAENPEAIEPVLCNPPHVSTSEVFRVVIEGNYASSFGVLEAVRCLFYDVQLGKIRRGSSGKGVPGIRRMGDILSQFDCTYDLHTIPPKTLVEMLPAEFDRFRKKAILD